MRAILLILVRETNVTGSSIFRKLIKNENYEKALSVARDQVGKWCSNNRYQHG